MRIFRTCRELGIATVAVVAPDDNGSLHARSADEMVKIDGYLQSEEHIQAAGKTGADAIHPGYGFLAESPAFADAVEAAGVVFVGPTRRRSPASGGDKLGGEGDRPPAPAFPSSSRAQPGEARLPARDQGRRRAAAGAGCASSATRGELDEALDAARREAGALRSATTASSASATSSDPATSRSSCSRTRTGTIVDARRARLLDPATPPEGARGVALDGGRRRPAGDRMSEAAVAFAQSDRLPQRRARSSSCSTAGTSSSSS